MQHIRYITDVYRIRFIEQPSKTKHAENLNGGLLDKIFQIEKREYIQNIISYSNLK